LLKVLHITESMTAAGGGTSTAFVELIESLLAHPDEIAVLAISQRLPPGDAALGWIASHDQSRWTFTGPPGRLRPGAMFGEALAALDRFRPDVLVLHGLWCTDLIALARLAQHRRIAVVVHPHGMLVRAALARSHTKKAMFRFLTGSPGVFSRAGAFVFATDGELRDSDLSMLGPSATSPARAVIPLAVNMAVAADSRPDLRAAGRARFNLAPGEPALVFMGRLHPVKRVELTIDAFAKASKDHPGLKLMLVGDGEATYVDSLRARAQSLGVLQAVIFAGWLSGDAKWQALAAADALIINSEFENFCYALVEALIVQTPVIMTDNLAMAPAAQNAGAGFMATSDPDALAAAITRLLAISTDRASMGARGRAWVEASFSRPAVGAALVRLYQSISKEPVAP